MSKTKPRAGEMALEAQARILARFHFALVPSGVPFLGKAQHQLRKEVCTPLTSAQAESARGVILVMEELDGRS